MFASDRTLIWLSVWLCCILHLYGQPQVLQQQQQYQQQDAPVRAFNDLQRGPAIIQRTPSQSQTVKQQPQKTEIIWEKIELIELPVIREQQSSQPQSYYQQPTNRLQFETPPQPYYPKVQQLPQQQQQSFPQSQTVKQQPQKTEIIWEKIELNELPVIRDLQPSQPQSYYQQPTNRLQFETPPQPYYPKVQQLPREQQQSFPNKYQPVQYGDVNTTAVSGGSGISGGSFGGAPPKTELSSQSLKSSVG